MGLFKTRYNKEYYFVFQPYLPYGRKRRRFMVSGNQLHNYIGVENAITALLKASKLRTDKLRWKLRSHGILDIYLK